MLATNPLFTIAARARACLNYLKPAKDDTRSVLSRVTSALNRRRGLKLGLGFGVLLLAASTLAVSHSTLASWFDRPLSATQPGQPISRQSLRKKARVDIPTTHRYREADQRLLTFAAPLLILSAPTNLAVDTASSTQIHLSWTAPSGSVNHYQVERSQSLTGSFAIVANPSTTSLDDTPASGVHSYLYRVRAIDSFGAPSPPSNMALGTSITFIDANLQAGVSVVKAQHLTELRQAINATRSIAGLSAATWTHSDLTNALIYAVDVQELRDKLSPALSALSIAESSYDDATLAAGTTLIKKVHIDQLRQRSTRASSTSSGPGDSYVDSATARLDPLNRTGGGGEDPLSRNFNWSIPLLGLPGRGGLDLGLSLAYNSLATWTKNGSSISFDDDYGSPAPGFRLGFPVIQAAYYNTQASKYSFLMISPSGGRVELRQVGTSGLYQAVDSSYLLLDSSAMILRTTDGTQLSYTWKGSDYECTQIKDRNGNYISINYDSWGRIDTVVDTLSRTITFNYNGNDLASITQSWAGTSHSWAIFTYANKIIQTNFSGLTVYGPANNSTIRALTRLTFADESHYDFDYTSWGQVWKISQYTGETSAHLLNYRSYNLPADNSTAQTDCPRFTVRHDWAENWNRDTNGAAQEVTTTFAAPVDAALPDNSLATVTRTQVTMPDGTSQKTYFAGNVAGGAGSAPAWKRGLPLLTETYEGSTIQRWVTTAWTQDDTNLAYQLNPRVTETKITDPAGNHARTSVEYAATTLSDGTTINLPQNTYEYQADASTVLRRTHVEYNLASDYISQRIIGLVSEQTLYGVSGGTETLMSKVSYQYDESGSIQGTDAPVQHDNSNYTASFRVGRGNLSSVKRYDVTNTSQFTTSTMQYNTAGAVVATLDPLNHGVTISYADLFSDDNNSRNTLAYPTTVTDPGGFSSSMKYNYDFGGATRKQTPSPNVTYNQAGPVQTIEYDSLGRLQKVKNLVNNAYTRYEYPASQIRVDTYATIQDNAGEAHSFKITDGHGRVIGSASDHPGSTGGFSGQIIYYDTMGRVIKQSNPTETSASGSNPYSWTATGDDATAGWLYTQQTYDWKGRPLVTTNTDNTTKSASYGGCGCAGGQVVTLIDEGTVDGGVAKRRQQKIYADVLGRTVKAEAFNWEGGSVYSTTVKMYNARDQVTLVRRYQGDDTSTVYQDTTMSYDGYGRLQSKHIPENDANTSTTYAYNSDDMVYSVTDARSASATYGYNNRGLVTGISYSAPSGITTTAAVSYSYDAVGNRISMTDGLGSQSYTYDQLSQLTSETRTITSVGTFTLAYSYTLAGQLAQVADQTSSTSFSYTYDVNGRMTAMAGAGMGSTTSLATNLQYRASGGLKQVNYGNGTSMSLVYNGRGLLTQYALGGVKEPNGQARAEGSDFLYYPDGKVKFATDYYVRSFYSISDHDRAYQYDHVGRLQKGLSSADANDFVNGTQTGFHGGPFQQTYTRDVWDNLVNRTGTYWGVDDTTTGTQTYDLHNRNTAWTYDAAGNLLSMNEPPPNQLTFTAAVHTYDAAGRHIRVSQTTSRPSPTNPNLTLTTTSTSAAIYDGDGRQVKRLQIDQTNSNQAQGTTYYLRSSVLGGQVITDYDENGTRRNSYVYAGSNLVYEQLNGQSLWHVTNPLTGDARDTDSAGKLVNETHLDPEGVDTGATDPGSMQGDDEPVPLPHAGAYAAFLPHSLGGSGRCTVDGMEIGCGFVDSLLRSGAAEECLDGNCGKQQVTMIGRDRNGNVIGRTTFDVLPGQPGWNGHLDGTYHLTPWFGSQFDPNSATSGVAFLSIVASFGERQSDFFARVSVGPQNPTPFDQLLDRARQLHNQPNRNDCLALVDLIRTSAKLFPNVISATSALGDVLTGSSSAYELAIRNAANDMSNPMVTFGNNGFQTSFAGDPGDNQVRHLMGGLLVGATLGAANGLPRMNARENPNIPGDVADMNLNGVSVRLGDSLRTHNSEYGLNPGLVQGQKLNWLADQVRNKVCK